MHEQNWLLEVVEAMPDGVVIVDQNGDMILVNREVERLTGYHRADLLGHRVEMLLPEPLRATHHQHRMGFHAAPRRRAMGHGMQLTALRADGSTFPVEIALAPAELDGDHVVIASIRDVTANRLADAELEAARQRVMLAEDHERIARDLHDTVIQRLFAAGLSLQSVLPVVPEASRAKIERILDDQDDAIRELRTAIFGLASKRSAGRTIRVVVNDLVDESARVLGFRPTLHFNGVLDTVDAPVTDEVAAVVREALSNVARHARARKVDVLLSHLNSELTLVVADDGSGIPSSHRLGSGLLNMQDRAARLGGVCTVTSGEHTGTTVRWLVPTSG
ncbi:MAG: PAS domain S-box protein [Ilumatobacter sp.]|nr:PAS domain S-box protein [Ilumatobacter sp.]